MIRGDKNDDQREIREREETTMAGIKHFEEARQRAGALNRLPPRVVHIAVGCVVGSVDAAKAAGLRPDFLPQQGTHAARYHSVEVAMRDGAPLPAIEVYGLGDAYYVVDGHHRVAAARRLGQLYLDAIVHQFLPPAGSSHASSDAPTKESSRPASLRVGWSRKLRALLE
jgi:hypothetical protein